MADRIGSGYSRRAALLALGGASVTLAGCAGSSPFGGDGPPAPRGTAPQTLGQGSVKVALILPLSASGNAGTIAASMRQAAEMALAEFQNPDIQLLVYDDQGTPQGAQAVATQALGERAQIILGPLFAPAVQAVGQIARPANVPVVAFSTDENVAARGVYLLSFLPSTDVRRIVSFSASQGRTSIAALLPDDAYGAVVDGELRSVAAGSGARIVGIERYPLERQRMIEPVRRLLPALRQADALLIPDGADAVGAMVETLRQAQAPLQNLKLLGTGRWEDPRLWSIPALAGGWYAAPDGAGFRDFAQRFRARFNTDPARTASLAYDSTLLVAALTKQLPPAQRFTEATLTNPNGFAGIDGVFRFQQSGANERGIAVLEIRNGGVVAVSPAPRTFGAARA